MEINPDLMYKQGPNLANKRPKVLIIGAGLAGITLAMLLERTNIPYEIFERAAAVKPLGSAIFLNSTTAKVFKQCGVYDELFASGKITRCIQIANENREIEYILDYGEDALKMFGSHGYILSRPRLYEILLAQVPKERFHMGKKMLSMENGGNGVLVRFSDGTTEEGDILVGADGAYSAVRQNLYAKLKKLNKLPKSDALPLPYSTTCLVGQTRPLDPEDFPNLKEKTCQFIRILGDHKPYTWTFFTTAANTVCFSIIEFLDEETRKLSDTFRTSEWGTDAAGAMIEQVRHLPIISGGDKITTVGDLIDLTPREYVSKVVYEEKLFKTWHHMRTVLIGDACHKLNPAGGSGAANAIHDAVTLANYINALPTQPSVEDIHRAFKDYKRERIPWVTEAFESSAIFRTMVETGIKAKMVRYVSKNMPSFMNRKMLVRMAINQPQCSFLPLIDDAGTHKSAKQPSVAQTLKMIEENKTRDDANAKKRTAQRAKQFALAEKDREERAEEIAQAKAEMAAASGVRLS
ncbi:FAD/NAD(P)-binding domain-containing protein [Linnemannia elongata AG-77]|uniref:FAD/NAD(P)-binding domain-containing protein n=1 Tax=Linnemannia elongata AG-77 TaxID=1314771 RepID=A0A197JYD8_9FUNG|nr:FAD/NAD(P)-binding domain-containing protein [Linnemannia elongata AG-77]